MLRAADQAELLGVPAGEHDGAQRLPAVLHHLAEALDELGEDRRAGGGVRGAERPRVPVVAEHHHLVLDVAGDEGVRVPDLGRLELAEVGHARHDVRVRPGPVAALDARHGALPAALCRRLEVRDGDAVLLEGAQDRRRVAVRDGERGDLGQRVGLVRVEARRVAVRGLARRRRVARVEGQRLHRAALDRRRLPRRALRVGLVAVRLRHLPVLGRVAVDQHAHGAALRRPAHLEPAERPAVPHQHDLAGDRDARGVERGKVLDAPQVRVHDLGVRDGPGLAVPVERRDDVRRHVRVVAHLVLDDFVRAKGHRGQEISSGSKERERSGG